MRKKILKLLDQHGDLPPFPDLLLKLQEKLNDPGTEFSDLATLIETDPVLAGNILKLSNSAYYSRGGHEVGTLSKAIQNLGLEHIKQLVFSLKLSGLFKGSQAVNYHNFWQHSLGVALVTQKIGQYTNVTGDARNIAYLSGLMHDVGVIVFGYLIPDEYMELLDQLAEKEETIQIQEKERFGIDHQELGARFVEKWWQMDAEIVQAVEYHHFPFQGTENEKQAMQLVNVADGICNNQGITNGIECFREAFKEGAWEQLGLVLSDVDSMIDDVRSSIGIVKMMLTAR